MAFHSHRCSIFVVLLLFFKQAALSRIQSRSSVFGSPTHGRHSSAGSTVSVDISEDAPDRLSVSSETYASNGSAAGAGVGVAGRPPTPSSSAVAAVAAVAAAAAAAVVAPVAAVASVVSPVSTTPTASDGRGAADDIKNRRQDWKLDAQELSLIRKEEERVMKPDVLTRLLAKGAGLGCEWDWCGGGSVRRTRVRVGLVVSLFVPCLCRCAL